MDLKKAKKEGKLEEFIKEHENDPAGEEEKFDSLLTKLVKSPSKAQETSPPASDESCSDTQTP